MASAGMYVTLSFALVPAVSVTSSTPIAVTSSVVLASRTSTVQTAIILGSDCKVAITATVPLAIPTIFPFSFTERISEFELRHSNLRSVTSVGL